MNLIDIGQTFGKLTVREFAGKNNRHERLWLMMCECGNETIAKTHNLRSDKTKSCGCLKTGPKVVDLSGKQFGRLLVQGYSHQDKWRTSCWKCICECGKETIVSRTHLARHRTRSCGCLKDETDKSRKGTKNPNYNPALSIEDRVERRFQQGYKDWAKTVKEKCNFICVICGSRKSGTLTSHHLNGYDTFPKERLLVENGVCLCEGCHVSFHKRFGYGLNTQEQFERFEDEFVRSNSRKG